MPLASWRSAPRQAGTSRNGSRTRSLRQTLYEETGAARRIRLHQVVGRALEESYGWHLDEHAAELAGHFSNSGVDEDLAKAIDYGERAARRAMDVYGYGEAACLLKQALDVQDVLDPDDKLLRCDLLLLLSEAVINEDEPTQASDERPLQAFLLAEDLGDRERAAAACQLALTALTTGRHVEMREWIDRAERYANTDVERARNRSMLGMLLRGLGERDDSRKTRAESVEIARTSQDADMRVATANTYLMLPTSPALEETKLALAREVIDLPREAVTIRRHGFLLWNASLEFLAWGDRTRAEQLRDELRKLADRTGHRVAVNSLQLVERDFAVVDGRFQEAQDFIDGVRGAGVRGTVDCAAMIYVGKAGEALEREELDRYRATQYIGESSEAWLLAAGGREKEARAMLDAVMSSGRRGDTDETLDTDELTMCIEAGLLLRDATVVEPMAAQLAVAPHLVTHRWSGPACVARILGDAMSFLSRPEEARAYYGQALEVSGRIRFRPEIALIRLGQAELIAAHQPDATDEALQHLAFVLPEFTDMGMLPALERATALQERLSGAPPAPSSQADGLSGREVEVLRLVAAGRTDKEIAEELVIAVRTASNHVGNILSKIAASNRAEAAAYAARHELEGDPPVGL